MNFNQLKAIANECVFSTEGVTIMKTEEYEYRLQQISQLTNNWNELEEFVEAEKTRLAKECSHTYEDSLGKTRYVNEDIFNELTKIIDKMKEIKENNNVSSRD